MGESVKAINVILVDEDNIVQNAIRRQLENEDHIQLVAQGFDGSVLLPLYDEFQPDVVILDIMMPKINGIAASKQLLRRHPQAKVVMLSTCLDDEMKLPVLQQMGVLGFVQKGSQADLIKAIERAYENKEFFSDKIQHTLSRIEKLGDVLDQKKLTKQEKLICNLLAMHMSVQSISEITYLDKKTIYTHQTNILKKLKVTLNQLHSFAEKYGFYGSAHDDDTESEGHSLRPTRR